MYPFADTDSGGLTREHLLQEYAMDLLVGVGAAVFEDGQVVVEVGCLPDGGQHDPAGGDAGQDKAAHFKAAENDLEVAAREGADSLLQNDNVIGMRSHRGMDLGGRI